MESGFCLLGVYILMLWSMIDVEIFILIDIDGVLKVD